MTSKTQNNQPTLDKQITTKQAALALCWLEILLPGPVCVCVLSFRAQQDKQQLRAVDVYTILCT